MNPNPVPSSNPVSNPLQPAAISLIVVGSLNGLLGALGVFSGIIQMISPAEKPPFKNSAEEFGYYGGQTGAILISVFSLVAAPIIIYGAVKMMKGASQAWAKASAILAIIPFTSCCCLLGVPVGIWALVVLSKPEAKAFFERGGTSYQPPPPPPPPQYYQPM